MHLSNILRSALLNTSKTQYYSFGGRIMQSDAKTPNICQAIRKFVTDCFRSHPERPFTVAIEGNIASGKTSFLENFRQYKQAKIYAEPVHKWRDVQGYNALGHMYADPERYALTFQTYVQLTMMETHLQQQVEPVKLMERSIFSAKYCFVENLLNSGLMPEFEYIVLSRWFDWIITNTACDLDLIVYLRTTPEVARERTLKRGRKEEKPVSMEYLQTLHSLHEEWLVKQTKFKLPCEVLVIDANQCEEGMKDQVEKHRKRILFGYDTEDSERHRKNLFV